jgi:hypothetical protein
MPFLLNESSKRRAGLMQRGGAVLQADSCFTGSTEFVVCPSQWQVGTVGGNASHNVGLGRWSMAASSITTGRKHGGGSDFQVPTAVGAIIGGDVVPAVVEVRCGSPPETCQLVGVGREADTANRGPAIPWGDEDPRLPAGRSELIS